MVAIQKSFNIDCAHNLREVFGKDHKCGRLHGHTYLIEVEVCYEDANGSPAVDDRGVVADFGRIKSCIVDRYDHTYLNESLRTHNEQGPPTAENLASVFADTINGEFVADELGGINRGWVHVNWLRLTEGTNNVAMYKRTK